MWLKIRVFLSICVKRKAEWPPGGVKFLLEPRLPARRLGVSDIALAKLCRRAAREGMQYLRRKSYDLRVREPESLVGRVRGLFLCTST